MRRAVKSKNYGELQVKLCYVVTLLIINARDAMVRLSTATCRQAPAMTSRRGAEYDVTPVTDSCAILYKSWRCEQSRADGWRLVKTVTNQSTADQQMIIMAICIFAKYVRTIIL